MTSSGFGWAPAAARRSRDRHRGDRRARRAPVPIAEGAGRASGARARRVGRVAAGRRGDRPGLRGDAPRGRGARAGRRVAAGRRPEKPHRSPRPVGAPPPGRRREDGPHFRGVPEDREARGRRHAPRGPAEAAEAARRRSGETFLEQALRQVLPPRCWQMQYRFGDAIVDAAIFARRTHRRRRQQVSAGELPPGARRRRGVGAAPRAARLRRGRAPARRGDPHAVHPAGGRHDGLRAHVHSRGSRLQRDRERTVAATGRRLRTTPSSAASSRFRRASSTPTSRRWRWG